MVFLAILRAMGGTIVQLLVGSTVVLVLFGILGQIGTRHISPRRPGIIGWNVLGSHLAFSFEVGFVASMMFGVAPSYRSTGWHELIETLLWQVFAAIPLFVLSTVAASFFVRRCRACQIVLAVNVVFFWIAVWLITQ